MVGLLAVGFVANLLIRPVDERFHEPGGTDAAEADRERERSTRMSARVAVAWAVVGIPLVYGLVETLNKASSLFTK